MWNKFATFIMAIGAGNPGQEEAPENGSGDKAHSGNLSFGDIRAP
jgi:hypothetical protein